MPNDAKLGLIIGVGLVIGVAVLFWRKDAAPETKAPATETPAAVGQPVSSLPRSGARAPSGTVARDRQPSDEADHDRPPR